MKLLILGFLHWMLTSTIALVYVDNKQWFDDWYKRNRKIAYLSLFFAISLYEVFILLIATLVFNYYYDDFLYFMMVFEAIFLLSYSIKMRY